jgi:hypothetical protein
MLKKHGYPVGIEAVTQPGNDAGEDNRPPSGEYAGFGAFSFKQEYCLFSRA